MVLPFDILSQNYVKPKLFLCQTDKQRICQLETISMNASFKFNTYSTLEFSIGRTYTNMITGETLVNPFYHQIEALRLLYLDGFGYFEIQDPEITSDGIKEIKNVTAYSLEYRLSQKYLEHFNINTGEADSLEVIAAGGSPNIIPITLLNDVHKNLSLLDLTLEKVYDWKIGYIDPSLKTMSRQFEISRASIYDFIVQDICEKFNCYAVFDTIENKINLYAESLITKHIGDGSSNTFVVSPAYDDIDTITIDSYKTTKYSYRIEEDKKMNRKIGYVTFDTPPDSGAKIEITDGSQTKWQTDVYVTFDNLAQEVNVSYSAEDIKTVLTVKGQDDLDIREVNMGLPYIVDLSYYYTVEWMGQELYDAYTKYLQSCNNDQDIYIKNAQEMLEVYDRISYEQGRASLQYSIADNVSSLTVGTYYVQGGTYPNYYYTEVKLPDEWKADTIYYMQLGSDLDEEKFRNLYYALAHYFKSKDNKDVSKLEELKESFSFMESYPFEQFIHNLSNSSMDEQQNETIVNFYNELLNQLGLSLLNNYKKTYDNINKDLAKEQGYDDPSSENYWRYYTSTLVVNILELEIEERTKTIQDYQDRYRVLQEENNKITNNALMDVFFEKYYMDQGIDANEAKKQARQLLVRLSPFLREDEYTDDTFVETDSDTIEMLMKTKQELLECGKIELAKLCEPKLAFSMDMANIYALKEFEPIIYQFQLGKLINVAIRDDYVKKARLLAVDINFDDFSDFSCEFGELTSLRTPSSIHADLLANALSAGNSVASNQSYWDQGADLATATDIKLQNGLINAIGGIYNSDQSVLIDNRGILLRKLLDNGEYSPYQILLQNNNILVSTDGFETAQTGIGVFEVFGREIYGVLAQAVLSGYIESSTIIGGTINIGDGAFVVHPDGTVTMNSPNNTITGYAKESDMERTRSQIEEIQEQKMYSVKITSDGPTVVTTSTDKTVLSCEVYSWDTDITDTLDDNLFAWKRISNNEEQDDVWNSMPEHQGVKTITISAIDIVENSSFICEVNLPE